MSEEILAWRGWELVGYSSGDVEVVRLRSLTRIFLWDSPSVVADRRPSQHSAHGLYAMRTRGQFVARYTPHVLGQVALSGIVVEGENGYRAERATIRSLTITLNPFPDMPLIVLADRLANHYQCEVTWEIEERKPAPDLNTAWTMQQAAMQQAFNGSPQQGVLQQGLGQLGGLGLFPGQIRKI